MNVVVGPYIHLPTHYGNFDVAHVAVHSASAARIREGVVLRLEPVSDIVLVRVQSSCLFSESFWATDCDCSLQLRESMTRIARASGTVLYFYEEGRGAGLETKFQAVRLQQEKGLDTQRAYECLNIRTDNRDYEAAAAVLLHLHKKAPLRLLSNNPNKVAGLRSAGVNIVEREKLVCGENEPAIRRYLMEKETVLGHHIFNH